MEKGKWLLKIGSKEKANLVRRVQRNESAMTGRLRQSHLAKVAHKAHNDFPPRRMKIKICVHSKEKTLVSSGFCLD